MIWNKALIDTNICIDAALERSPFAIHAQELIDHSERGNF
jgi:predicted nucleic acid-binding protein